jgi:hypothetical protein
MIFEEINFPQMALIWPADEFKSISEICANNLRNLRESFQLQNKNHSI